MKKILIFAVLLFVSVCARGEDMKLYSFADWLFQDGDYYRAISEYKRFIYFSPDGSHMKNAYYRIGLSYLLAGKFDDAASAFESTAGKFKGKAAELSLLAEAEAYFRKKDYNYSSMVARKLSANYPGSGLINKAAYMEAYNSINLKLYGDAMNAFKQLSEDPGLGASSKQLADYLKKNGDIREKSLVLSSVLSAIVPGAGYAYCDRWLEGFISLAVNAYFGYNTYLAFKNNQPGGEYGYGIPAAIFYLSNIYGSGASAARFNEGEHEKFIDGAVKFRIDILDKEF